RDFWLVGGASNTGGAVLAHFFSGAELARLSAQIDPDRDTGLGYYPLLSPGERFPRNDPDFAGFMSPRPEDDALFLAGLFEGIAAVEATCYREIERRGGRYPTRIFSAGGGAANAVYARIRSRCLGLAVERATHGDAAIGTARLAGWVAS
ncbi:MAG: FGGY-family carbohydrate kinase, partial [Pseudomonadota bacterium]